MRDSIELIAQLWPIMLSLVGLIAWIVRLESQAQAMRLELESLKIKHHALDSKVVEQLSQVRESLARIEGKLGVSIL